MEYLVLDRIEEGKAVLEKEDKSSVEVEASALPDNAKEGDVMSFIDGKYAIDKEETERLRNKNKDLFKKLMDK